MSRTFIANIRTAGRGRTSPIGRIEIIFHDCDPEPANCPIEEVVKVGIEYWFADANIEVAEFENGKRLRAPGPRSYKSRKTTEQIVSEIQSGLDDDGCVDFDQIEPDDE